MFHVVVPIDFSKESLVGLELAILLSKKIESQISMIHVLKTGFIGYPSPKKEDTDYVINEFNKIIETFSPSLPPKVKLDYIIKTGKIYKEVVNYNESFEDSFIVASTHGASGFEMLFIGSNAFRIISASKKPVFTIRGMHLPENISKIVLPIDVTSDSRQKIPFTVEIAKRFNAEIHLIAVTSIQTAEYTNKLNAYSKQAIEYFESKGVAYKSESFSGTNSVDLILDYSKKINADLISVMTEQASDSSYIIGTAAHQILNRSEIPVLSMNRKDLSISSFA